MPAQIKDPSAVLDYVFDWSADTDPWLAVGEEIVESSWVSTPAGLVIDSSSNDATTATVWLSGGTLGAVYEVVNHIVTNQGREDDKTLHILIRNT